LANYGKLAGSAMVCHSLLKCAIVCLGKFQQTLAKDGKLWQTSWFCHGLPLFAEICQSLRYFAIVCQSLLRQISANYSKLWQTLKKTLAHHASLPYLPKIAKKP
jgi:hypothetical protein